jgi:WD40 repeat protein
VWNVGHGDLRARLRGTTAAAARFEYIFKKVSVFLIYSFHISSEGGSNGHTGPITSVICMADTHYAFTASRAGELKMWDLDYADCAQTLTLPREVWDLLFLKFMCSSALSSDVVLFICVCLFGYKFQKSRLLLFGGGKNPRMTFFLKIDYWI